MKCATNGFPQNRDTGISQLGRARIELRPRHSCRRTEHWNWTGCGREPAGGRTELKVIRSAAAGTALGTFGPWAEVIDRAWQLGSEHPAHLVSDGNGAIAAGIGLVYGREAPHQLCAFRLLREYMRNTGGPGFVAARLLNAGSLAEAEGYAAHCRKRTGRRHTGVRKRW